jgi:hypothetical protein
MPHPVLSSPTFHLGMLSTAHILIWICIFAGSLRAQGYVDPGAGAMLWQILAASFLGAVFLFRKLALRWFKNKKLPPDL